VIRFNKAEGLEFLSFLFYVYLLLAEASSSGGKLKDYVYPAAAIEQCVPHFHTRIEFMETGN
jgi:hypothetical protein